MGMNRRALALAIVALLIGGGVGTTVGAVTANPSPRTVTVEHVVSKTETRTVPHTLWSTVTETQTKTVTVPPGGGGGGSGDYTGCPTEPTDPPNCEPPPEPSNPAP